MEAARASDDAVQEHCKAQFFSLECTDAGEVALGSDTAQATSPTCFAEDDFLRDCRELQASKLNLRMALHRERQREEDVSSLLQRLDSLPGDAVANEAPADFPAPAASSAEPALRQPTDSFSTTHLAQASPSAVASATDVAPAAASRSRTPETTRSSSKQVSLAVASMPRSPRRARAPPPPLGSAAWVPGSNWAPSEGVDESPSAAPAPPAPPMSLGPERFAPAPPASTRQHDAIAGSQRSVGAVTCAPSPPSTPPPRAGGSFFTVPTSPQGSQKGSQQGASWPSSPRFGAVSPPLSPRQGEQGTVADELDSWRGWSMRTTSDGSLFYYNSVSGITQWEVPGDLTPVLGEWRREVEPGGDGRDAAPVWKNEVLGARSLRDPRHTTNLLHAALDGDEFFVQLYAHAGGSFEVSDEEGRTVLHLGCAGGCEQIMTLLLNNGARVDALDNGGATPLHWACRYGRASLVGLLLQAHADPNLQSNSGDTPAHEAAALGDVSALRWLLHARASPSRQNGSGLSPIDLAARSDQYVALELLRSAARRGSRRAVSRIADLEGESDEAEQPARHEEDLDGHLSALPGMPGEMDQSSPTSPAIKVVRAARPVLNGVRWVAARLFGEASSPAESESKQRHQPRPRQWFMDDAADEASTASSDDSDDRERVSYHMQAHQARRQRRDDWLHNATAAY